MNSQQAVEDTEAFATPITVGNRESLMNAMWEARGLAFKVIEARWKTFEKNGKMKSESGQRRVLDGEVETLQKLYELAWFIVTDTFDANVNPVLELEIQDMKGRSSIYEKPIQRR